MISQDRYSTAFEDTAPEDSGIPKYVLDRLNVSTPPTTTISGLNQVAQPTTQASSPQQEATLVQEAPVTTTGGLPTTVTTPDYSKMVMDAYGTIGRSGVGEGANQIDQAGLNAWTQALQTGVIKPEDLSNRFSSAVTDYIAQNPEDKYTKYVNEYRSGLGGADTGATNTGATTAATTTVGGLSGTIADTKLNNNNVIALGDSTTWGYNAGNQLGTNMVSSAQNTLGKDYTIQNMGVNSTTVGDLLSNAGGNNNWANTLASDAGVVVLNYGLNEASRGEDPATFEANLTKAVNDLKAAGKAVVLQTPNVVSGVDWGNKVGSYADVIRNVAQKTGSALDDKYATTSKMENIFDTTTGDTIHPNADTYGVLGTNLANTIAGLNAKKTTADTSTSGLPADTAATTTGGLPATASKNPLVDLYKTTLGREPTQAEIDSWGFGDTIDANELNRFLGSARNEAVNTMSKDSLAGKLADQILSQGTSSKWTGEGYGSPEKTAYDMGVLLAGQGITDINQLGMVDRVSDIGVTPKYDFSGDGSAKFIGYTDFEGNPVDASKVIQTEDGFVAKDVVVGKTFGNKETGKPLESYYDKAQGNIWGGTFAGKGSTSYGVQFDASGKPIFYSQYGGSSNDLANLMQDLGPIAQIGLAVATGGLSIPEQLAANFAVQVLSGQDIGDAIKNAAVSYAGSQIPGLSAVKEGTTFLNGIDSTGVLSKAFQNAVASGGTALLTGKDVGDAMVKGAVTGGTNGAINALMGNIDGFKDLTPAQKSMVTNAVTGVISGKPLDQIVINTAIAAANNEVAKAKSATANQVLSPYFTPTTGGLTTTAGAGTAPSGLQVAGDTTGVASNLGGVDAKTQSALDAMKGVDKIAADATAGTTTPDTEFGDLQGAIDRNTADNQARAAKLDAIATAPNFSDAYRLAREALGAGQTFTWNGKSYGTNTAEENQAIATAQGEAISARNLAGGTAEQKALIAAQRDSAARDAAARDAAARTSASNLFAENLNPSGYDFTGGNAVDAMGNVQVGSQGAGTPDTALGRFVDTASTKLGQGVQQGLNVGSGFISGGANLLNQAGTLYGLATGNMDNVATQTAGQIKSSLNDILTSDFKGDRAAMSQAIAKAGGEGFFAQLAETFKQYGSNPVQLANFLAEQGPTLLTGAGAMSAAKLMGAGVTAGEAATIVANAGLQGADVASDIYKTAIANNQTPEEALSSARTGALLSSLTSAVANKFIPGALSTETAVAAQAAGRMSLSRAIAGEVGAEVAEEASGKVFQNLLTGQPWDKDLGTTVAQAIIASGGLTASVQGTLNALNKNVQSSPTTESADSKNFLLANGAAFGAKAGDTSNQGINPVTGEATAFNASADKGGATSFLDGIRNQAATLGLTAALTFGGMTGATAGETTGTMGATGTQVTMQMQSGVDANTAISNAIQSAAQAGTNITVATASSVSAAINAGENASTAIQAGINASVNAGADVNSAITASVNAAMQTNANKSAVVDAAVQSAVALGMNADTALQVAMTAATNPAVTAETSPTVNPAVNTAVNPATNPAVNPVVNPAVNVALNTAVNTPSVSPLSSVTNPPTVVTPTTTTVTPSTTTVTPPTTTVTPPTTTVVPPTTTVTPPPKVVTPPPSVVTPTVTGGLPTGKYAFPTIETVPSFLKGAPPEKAMQLAALKQIYSSLTPEMQEVLAERGIAPIEETPVKEFEKESEKDTEKDSEKKGKKSDKAKTYEEWMAEQEAGMTPEQLAEKYSTKFAATGGSITDMFNPNLKTTPSILTGAPITDAPFKLSGLKHLKEGISKAPRAMGGLAQGGLPQKYAKAAPKGHNPEFITGLTGYYAQGDGTGQSDDIPAMLHDGDYVIDADAVAALGDGSSKAGAQALSKFQSKIPHSMAEGGEAVPAKIADGEYVFPAAFVSALGGGDNKKGAKLLDAMREELREHKRSAPTSKIPPKAKSPLDYLRMAKG